MPKSWWQRFRENVIILSPVVPGATLRASVSSPNPNSATKQGPFSGDCFVSALSLRETSVPEPVPVWEGQWGSRCKVPHWFNLTLVRGSLSAAVEIEASKVCPALGIP